MNLDKLTYKTIVLQIKAITLQLKYKTITNKRNYKNIL